MRLLIFSLLLASMSYGQITLTVADFADGGDTIRVSSAADPTIDYATTGEGITWDFSYLVAESQVLKDYDDLSNAPLIVNVVFGAFAAQDYQASNAIVSDDIPIEQMTQILPITITDVRQFSKNTADSITSIGFSMIVEGSEIPVKSDTIEKRYEFPLTYGNTYSSRGYTNLDMNPIYNAMWIQYRQRSSEVEGWGTVITPYGSFEALKIRHNITEIDSIFLDLFGPMWIELPIPDAIVYEWIALGELEPVMTITTNDIFGNTTVTGIEYKDIYLGLDAGIEEINNEVSISPNPVTNELRISGVNGPFQYSVVDLTGKVCQTGEIDMNSIIDVSMLTPGAYVLFLSNGSEKSLSKFIKD